MSDLFSRPVNLDFCRDNKHKQNVELAWDTFLNQQSILDTEWITRDAIYNPLPNIFKKMRINYNRGGYFEIKRVRLSPHQNQFVDYHILIENVEDPGKYEFLKNLSEESLAGDPRYTNRVTDFDDIKDAIVGLGRMI